MEKTYVARVLGVFPETPEPLVVSVPLAWDQRNNHVTACPEPETPATVPQQDQGSPEQDCGGQGLRCFGTGPPPAPEHASPANGDEAAQHSTTEPTDASTDVARRRHAFREQRRLKAAAKKRRQAEQRAAAEAARASGVLQAKPAVTEFRLLAVAPDHLTSLVECRWVPDRPAGRVWVCRWRRACGVPALGIGPPSLHCIHPRAADSSPRIYPALPTPRRQAADGAHTPDSGAPASHGASHRQ